MAAQRDVAVVVGSLRRKSFNRMMAHAMSELVPERLALSIVEIGDLPLYNQDLEDAQPPPEPWVAFRRRILAADALVFLTPEYNRSGPGCLKNAIDVGSRPYGSSVWNGKPGAVMSVTPGQFGAFGANQHLRQSLVSINVPTMAAPEAYIGGAGKLFDAEGKLIDDRTRELVRKFLAAFDVWVETLLRSS